MIITTKTNQMQNTYIYVQETLEGKVECFQIVIQWSILDVQHYVN